MFGRYMQKFVIYTYKLILIYSRAFVGTVVVYMRVTYGSWIIYRVLEFQYLILCQHVFFASTFLHL